MHWWSILSRGDVIISILGLAGYLVTACFLGVGLHRIIRQSHQGQAGHE